MDLNAKTILNHKVVAVVNLIWAIFHIWIAIEIEEDYGFLAIVIVFVLIFVGTYMISENIARKVVSSGILSQPAARHKTRSFQTVTIELTERAPPIIATRGNRIMSTAS